MAGLGEDLSKIVETNPLAEAVGGRVAAAIHVEDLVIVLEEGGFVPVYQRAGDAVPNGLVSVLAKGATALSVYWEDRASWLY